MNKEYPREILATVTFDLTYLKTKRDYEELKYSTYTTSQNT